jgi:hypothetical protein
MSDVLTLDEVADVLRLTASSQRERRRLVRQLIASGDLRPVNPNVGPRRLTVSRWELARYVGAPGANDIGGAA